MKKDFKKVYSYGLIMIVAVLIIVLIACLSESRLDTAQEEYESMLSTHQNEIRILEGEIDELRETVNQNMDIQAKLDKHNQIMSDLTEVYNLIEAGEEKQASDKIARIEINGFDDGELAFYETLKKLLND